jgi:2-polyprenyl-3-methyl-5-hydroxy-6-metoxy-1,4-benzoquinol methylase
MLAVSRRMIDRLTQYEEKFKVIAPYLGMSVLDIGCGNGPLIQFLPKGASYVGIDVNPESINSLRLRHPEYAFHCLDLEEDSLIHSVGNGSFSTIVSSAVIEHLNNPDFFLHQCQLLMNDDTRLIITTPTGLGDLVSRTFEKLLTEPGTKDIHSHVRHYSRKELASLGEALGLACTHYQRLGWHRHNQLAIYSKRLKSGDQDG